MKFCKNLFDIIPRSNRISVLVQFKARDIIADSIQVFLTDADRLCLNRVILDRRNSVKRSAYAAGINIILADIITNSCAILCKQIILFQMLQHLHQQ